MLAALALAVESVPPLPLLQAVPVPRPVVHGAMKIEFYGWSNWRHRRWEVRDYGNRVRFDFRFFAVVLRKY